MADGWDPGATCHGCYARDGVSAQLLVADRAFHSRKMAPIQAELAERIADVSAGPPGLPLIDSLGGGPAGAEFATAGYWVRQLREPVRFGAALSHLEQTGVTHFLEIGPGAALSALVAGRTRGAIPSLRPNRAPLGCLLDGLAQLFVAGAAVRWQAWTGDRHRLASELPAYPFQHQRYWFDAGERPARPRSTATELRSLGVDLGLDLGLDRPETLVARMLATGDLSEADRPQLHRFVAALRRVVEERAARAPAYHLTWRAATRQAHGDSPTMRRQGWWRTRRRLPR